MADRALSIEAVLTGLRDIRLPPEAAGGLPGEVLAALGLGLALAALIAALFRGITRIRPPAAAAPGGPDLAALARMPEAEQRLALLHLLKARDPAGYAALAAGLYAPGGLPDLARLWAGVRGHG